MHQIAESFDAAMTAFGPFEAQPELAVGVSGGSDSTALILLAHAWALRRGGRATAIIVDHNLRPGSDQEARAVAAALKKRSISNVILTWTGAVSGPGTQARAREARYDLLHRWCVEHRVLHLLVGHQLDDQFETRLLRKKAGSSEYGLAGMSALRDMDAIRLLRPLLGTGRAELQTWLEGEDVSWIEDPSNRNDRFARASVRREVESWDAGRREEESGILCRAAADRNRTVAEVRSLLARNARLSADGLATLDANGIGDVRRNVGLRALGQLILVVGGKRYLPRFDSLARLYDGLTGGDFAGRTLGRCVFSKPAGAEGHVQIRRELRGPPRPMPLEPGVSILWDGRFRIEILADVSVEGLELRQIGKEGIKQLQEWPLHTSDRLSPDVIATHPGLWREEALIGVPTLNWLESPAAGPVSGVQAVFRPRYRLDPENFMTLQGLRAAY